MVQSPLLKSFIKFLLIINLIALVGSYFAMPVYRRMNPTSPITMPEWVERWNQALMLLDVVAAALALRKRHLVALAIFFATSCAWLATSIAFQLTIPGKLVSVGGVLTSVLLAYSDVALLVLLMWHSNRRSANLTGLSMRKPS
jgi:hypothetical protein